MSKTIIGLVVAGLVVVGGAAYFVVNKNSDKDTPAASQTADNSSDDSSTNSGDGPSFAPATTDGLSFEATSTVEASGKTIVSTIAYDGKQNYQYSADQGGQSVSTIVTKKAVYVQVDDQWYKYAANYSSGFNPADYKYDASTLDAWKASSDYKGQGDCPAGTCDIWEVSTGAEGQQATSTVYLDTSTNRISKLVSETGSGNFTIEYNYKPVTITVPKNAKTFPGYGQ